MIASLVGDGIAIALESGVAAAEAVLRGEEADDYQRSLSSSLATPLAVAEALRWAAATNIPGRLLVRLIQRRPGLAALAARLTRIG